MLQDVDPKRLNAWLIFSRMPRTIVIGDVHGCALEFEALLLKLKLKAKDHVIQVGDLINRGPDSRRTIELAKEHAVKCILGNHEVRLLNAYKQKTPEILKESDQAIWETLTKADWKFLQSLPPYLHMKTHKTVIVHAGFLPKPAWHKQDINTITQIRTIDAEGNPCKQYPEINEPTWADYWKAPPFVVYGHTVRNQVVRRPGSIGIDTGCVYGGHLTAYVLEDQSVIQVPARKSYASVRS